MYVTYPEALLLSRCLSEREGSNKLSDEARNVSVPLVSAVCCLGDDICTLHYPPVLLIGLGETTLVTKEMLL